MNAFNRSVDELIPILKTQKVHLKQFLKKNFKKTIHYIEIPHKSNKHVGDETRGGHGGHNRIDIMLTEEAFKLLENSYNMRNRNITTISSNINIVNIVLPIETQTIGFIEKSYNGCVETIRQFNIGTYRVDLYFPKYKIVVECDEFGHVDRDINYEIEREKYIISQGNDIIRYNPNEIGFDLSNVLRNINCIIMKSM
jgi:hypothetical protein